MRFTLAKPACPTGEVRVCGVRFGINYEYNRTNIERITVRQSVSPWCESLPSAEVEATVNNSGQLYNMINPRRAVRLFTGRAVHGMDGEHRRGENRHGGGSISPRPRARTGADRLYHLQRPAAACWTTWNLAAGRTGPGRCPTPLPRC